MLFCFGFEELEEQVSGLFVLGLIKLSTHVVVLLFCLRQEVYELKNEGIADVPGLHCSL